jgi:hypothetical protein
MLGANSFQYCGPNAAYQGAQATVKACCMCCFCVCGAAALEALGAIIQLLSPARAPFSPCASAADNDMICTHFFAMQLS